MAAVSWFHFSGVLSFKFCFKECVDNLDVSPFVSHKIGCNAYIPLNVAWSSAHLMLFSRRGDGIAIDERALTIPNCLYSLMAVIMVQSLSYGVINWVDSPILCSDTLTLFWEFWFQFENRSSVEQNDMCNCSCLVCFLLEGHSRIFINKFGDLLGILNTFLRVY